MKLVLSIMTVLLVSATVGAAAASNGEGSVFAGLYSEIFLDPEGELTLEEITSSGFAGEFTPNRKKHFSFGLSTHANWLRFRIDHLNSGGFPVQDRLRLSFNYSCFGDIRVFVPVARDGRVAYEVLKGGILNGPNRDDHGFVFPIFDLPSGTAVDFPVYVRIRGPFTTNFQLILTEKQASEPERLLIVLFLGFVFGVMGAMVVYNLVLFFVLRDQNYLWYVIYLTFMMVYQGVICGVFRLIDRPLSDFLTAHVVLLCFAALAAHIRFAWSFLNVRLTAPRMRRLYHLAWAMCLIGAVFSLLARTFQANLTAYIVGFVVPFLLIATIVISLRNGHWISRYYLLAVSMLLISVLIFVIRGFGLIQHSIITSYSVLVSAALETVLLSFALADRVKRLKKKHYFLQQREKELSRVSITDELTGLFNRRYFNTVIRDAVRFAQDPEEPMSFMMLDIDHFKRVNDTYGHPKGDEVLRKLGDIILKNVRISDYPCRIGGEEFAVIMGGTGLEGSWTVAERIRHELGAWVFSGGEDRSFSVTISIGLVLYRPGESLHSLYDRADKALYQAKAQGRNRTLVLD